MASHLQPNFVSAVSHEFRTPLSSILALTERLDSNRVSDKQMLREYHATLRRNAKRLSVLIDRLLDFAQLEDGKKTFSFRKVDLFLAADEAVQAFQHSEEQQQVRFSQTSNGDSFHVFGDTT